MTDETCFTQAVRKQSLDIMFDAANLPAARSLKLFYFDAGGGHRSAATALRDVMREYFPHWRVELVDLFSDVLRPLDPLHRLSGYHVEDIYNAFLKRGWTYGFTTLLRLQRRLIRLYAPELEDVLRHYWQCSESFDLVVSLVPHFNGMMMRSLRNIHPQVPYVTVMTDLADCPPHFWHEKHDHFIVCGSDMAARQARTAGYQPEKVFKTSGMILKPHFYRSPSIDKRREREKLGLDPDKPTALIMFGANGARSASVIVGKLSRVGMQSIVMCGRNEKLRKALQKKRGCLAVGFTAEKVPYFMSLADFFIGKPGPGSISEAVHMGLPVIVEHSRRTMPQERYNVQWLKEQKLGIAVKNFSSIVKAVRQLLDENRFEQFRSNAARLKNNAVYEIPKIFEQIMSVQAGEMQEKLKRQ